MSDVPKYRGPIAKNLKISNKEQRAKNCQLEATRRFVYYISFLFVLVVVCAVEN
jgi:hypothetical protein